MDEPVVAALVEQVLAGDVLTSSCNPRALTRPRNVSPGASSAPVLRRSSRSSLCRRVGAYLRDRDVVAVARHLGEILLESVGLVLPPRREDDEIGWELAKSVVGGLDRVVRTDPPFRVDPEAA